MLNVVFCATPDIALPTLQELHENPHVNLKLVVSKISMKQGRGMKIMAPPVVQFCKKNNLLFHQTENINKDEFLFDFFKKEEIDILLVFAFSQFLSSKVLALPQVGAFNIHTSLLPRWRGAAPIQYAILKGDRETGVSLQKMVKKMDAGDVVLTKTIPLLQTETTESLTSSLAELSSLLVQEFITKAVEKSLKYQTQKEEDVTFAPLIQKEEAYLNLEKDSAIEMERKIRAFYPWPAAYCLIEGKRVKVLKAEMISETQTLTGEPFIETKNQQLLFHCRVGTLRFTEVKPEGKAAMKDTDFLRGLKHHEKK